MRKFGLIIAFASAAALFGTAGVAQAQTARGKAPLAADTKGAARDAYTLDQAQGRQVIELDSAKRWGLKLTVQPPVTRDVQLKDVEAGAYYKFNPSFRLGGEVGLADKIAPDAAPKARKTDKEQVAPRVKLNAIFKF
jgi:hypothetical protein